MAGSHHCLGCLKYLMFIFNLVFWLGGCGLFGVGVWLAVTQAPFASLSSSFPSVSAANLILVAGGVTMVIGFIGCLGAVKEHRCLLMSFFVILLLIFLTEVIVGGVLYFYREQFDRSAQEDLKKGMIFYNKKGNEGLSVAWDTVQEKFKCCGVYNSSDWKEMLGTSVLPRSCCSVAVQPHCKTWDTACYRQVKDWLHQHIYSVLVFGIAIGIVQVFALGFSLLLYCQIRRAEKYLN
ncbi:tetraspanin-4 [Polyodon spathula]|uniref:tetraspanin-4 n=1 Tax=Polyodon spathula TaxID=7913 RepID=UPI001B7E16F5|nr:tetraspanin-4 [Polyodon spathula]